MIIERSFNSIYHQTAEHIVQAFIELQLDSFLKEAIENTTLNTDEVNAA